MTRIWNIVLLLSVFLAAACGDGAGDSARVQDLPKIKAAPAFDVTNFNGVEVRNIDLDGSVYVAYFFFTSCGGPCPVMNSTANVLQAEYADRPNFRIIGFSVDPERDDLQRLTSYAERYNARPGTWYMARSSIDSVRTLASEGFMMGDPDTPAMHSTRFALVDRNGVIRGYYDGTDMEKVRDLQAAIDHLLEEEG